MRAGEETHIGSHQRSCPDADETGVENRAVEVDEDVGREADVEAVVDADRGFDPGGRGEDLVGGGCGGRWGEGSWVLNYAGFGERDEE